MAKKYSKNTLGRDYMYDMARGTYSKTFVEKAEIAEKRKKKNTILQPDTDDHGRFTPNPDPVIWGTAEEQ